MPRNKPMDLYFTSKPQCPDDFCDKSGSHKNADTMHKNVDAFWTSKDCEKLVKKFVFGQGGTYCPIYTWKVVKSLADVIKSVRKRCGEHHYVRVLRFKAHGNSRGIHLGSDFLTYQSTRPENVGAEFYDGHQIASLREFMVPGMSLVLFESCETGLATDFLKRFSELLGGVAVMGPKQYQYSNLGKPKLEKRAHDDAVGKFVDARFTVCNTKTCIEVKPLEPGDLAVRLATISKEGGPSVSYLHPPGATTPPTTEVWVPLVDE